MEGESNDCTLDSESFWYGQKRHGREGRGRGESEMLSSHFVLCVLQHDLVFNEIFRDEKEVQSCPEFNI